MLKALPLLSALTACSLALLTGCQSSLLPAAPQTSEITALTQRITSLESGIQGSSTKIDTVQTSIDSNYKATISTLQQQRQQAADAVYAAAQANQQNPQQNAYTTTIAESLQIASANLGGSDAQGMQNAATQLKLQLAGTKSDLAQLQAMHDAQLKAAATLQSQLSQEQSTRAAAQTQLAQLENTRNQLQTSLQSAEDKRNQAQTTLSQKLEAENQSLANDAALKQKLMFWLVAAGALAGIAAAVAFHLYPPIGLHLGLASGGFFLAAYLVAIVQPWMVLLVVGLSLAAIIWAVVIRHQRLSGIANSALGAIQQLKVRAAQGDAVAQQAYAQVESDLKNHFGAQIGSLEAEAKQRLDKLPWLPSSNPVAAAPAIAATPAAPVAPATPSTPPVAAVAPVVVTPALSPAAVSNVTTAPKSASTPILSSIASSAADALQELKARAAQGDALAQQAYAQATADLKSRLDTQIDSLETKAKQDLDKITGVQSTASTPATTSTPATPVTPAPASSTPSSSGAAVPPPAG